MGGGSSNLDPNTSDAGTQIGHTGESLLMLYTKNGVTTVTPISQATIAPVVPIAPVPVPVPTSTSANPCHTNLKDTMLTKVMVQGEYPAFKWDPTKPWTAEEMQCWAWLATKSKIVHPDVQFTKQYGFEPYLI